MATVIDGTTGTSIAGASSTVGNFSVGGDLTVTGAVNSATGALYPLVSGTVNAGGTNPFPSSAGPATVDFTGIPSTAKRITVMFSGVSLNGTSNILVQLGDSGGFEITGYASVVGNNAATATSTAGLIATSNGAAGSILSGMVIITLINTNSWVSTVTLGDTSNTQTPYAGGGAKSTSDTLDRIRITTVNGSDLFDAGSINVMWE